MFFFFNNKINVRFAGGFGWGWGLLKNVMFGWFGLDSFWKCVGFLRLVALQTQRVSRSAEAVLRGSELLEHPQDLLGRCAGVAQSRP